MMKCDSEHQYSEVKGFCLKTLPFNVQFFILPDELLNLKIIYIISHLILKKLLNLRTQQDNKLIKLYQTT